MEEDEREEETEEREDRDEEDDDEEDGKDQILLRFTRCCCIFVVNYLWVLVLGAVVRVLLEV